MKKIIYFLCAFALTLFSCSVDESAELGSQTKEPADSGSAGINPQANALKSTLCSSVDGWKMTYEPNPGEIYDFYMKFTENGLVETDSRILEPSRYTVYEIEPGTDRLVLKIQGGGHLSYLGEMQEERIVITNFSNNGIESVGAIHGKKMNMVPAADGEMGAMQKKKKLLVAMQNKGLMRGVIRNQNNKMIAYYMFDHVNNKIKFVYIENRLCKQVEVAVTMQENDFLWSDITIGDIVVNGYSYVESSDVFIVNGTETKTLKLVTNAGVLKYFDNRNRQFQISKTNGVGDAKDDIFEETSADILKTFEINCTMGKRPLVAIINGGGYIFYDACKDDDEVITKADSPDRVYFTNVSGGNPLWGGTEAHKSEINSKLSKFLSAWFHADGLYLVQEVGDDSATYLYFLSATTDSWFKVKQSK